MRCEDMPSRPNVLGTGIATRGLRERWAERSSIGEGKITVRNVPTSGTIFDPAKAGT